MGSPWGVRRSNQKILPALPGFTAADLYIASEDGAELYHFDSEGRHLRTLNTLTGAVLYQFAYDANGHLFKVTDGDGNITTIEPDANGNPSAIVAPFGFCHCSSSRSVTSDVASSIRLASQCSINRSRAADSAS